MRNKISLCCIAIVLAFGLQTALLAQESQPPLSPADREELDRLVERFEFQRPARATVAELRVILNRLREYETLMGISSERLVVCEVSDDPHLQVGDVIYLYRLGSSANVRMTVVRNEGQANESHPWTSPGGGDTIIINPSITGKKHSNPAYVKFTPEGVGLARIDPHDGGPEDHVISMRRNTRVNYPNDCNTAPGDEDMIFFVPPHESGGRHGGHAVAN